MSELPGIDLDAWRAQSQTLDFQGHAIRYWVAGNAEAEPLLAQGRLVRLKFKNTKNELRLPMHLIWLKNRPLDKAARELVELMRTAPQES